MKNKTATERALQIAGEEARAVLLKAALGRLACPACGSLIEISRWGSEKVMRICNNATCGLWHRPMSDSSC